MSFRLEFTPSAAKDYAALDPALKPRVAKALRKLEEEPLSGKPLQGPYRGLFSLRVGDYRAVYRADPASRLIVVHRIGHRRDVYR